MKTPSVTNEFMKEFSKLPHDLQLRVLDYTKALILKGVKGKDLCKFEGLIPDDELSLIAQAIEDNCEKVDAGEW
jgi:hypothetical protein